MQTIDISSRFAKTREQRDSPESADSDDTDLFPFDAVSDEGRIDRETSTIHRRGVDAAQSVGNRKDESLVDSNGGRVSSVRDVSVAVSVI